MMRMAGENSDVLPAASVAVAVTNSPLKYRCVDPHVEVRVAVRSRRHPLEPQIPLSLAVSARIARRIGEELQAEQAVGGALEPTDHARLRRGVGRRRAAGNSAVGCPGVRVTASLTDTPAVSRSMPRPAFRRWSCPDPIGGRRSTLDCAHPPAVEGDRVAAPTGSHRSDCRHRPRCGCRRAGCRGA